MTMEEVSEGVMVAKPIRKIISGQDMFVNMAAFTDDMDEHTIEMEWGRSTGSTILPESSCKYDILDRIDQANRELDHYIDQHYTGDSANRKSVRFSEQVQTAHYLSPHEGDIDEHEEVEAGGYWSAEEISATPEQDIDGLINTYSSVQCLQSGSTPESDCFTYSSSRSPDVEWYDSEDGSSADLSALTDSVDRLDLSPIHTDSPDHPNRPASPPRSQSPVKRVRPVENYENDEVLTTYSSNTSKRKTMKKWNHITQDNINIWNKEEQNKAKWNSEKNNSMKWKSGQNINLNAEQNDKSNWDSELNSTKWNAEQNLTKWSNEQTNIRKWNAEQNKRWNKTSRWNLAVNRLVKCAWNQKMVEEEGMIRRCLAKQDQTKLPKYNGLRSEYGLSQQQLIERRRMKTERKQSRQQKRKDRKSQAEERKKANEVVFNNWLDKKKQQEKQNKRSRSAKDTPRTCVPPPTAITAHIPGMKKCSIQTEGSKISVLRRILSASVNSPKQQMTYSRMSVSQCCRLLSTNSPLCLDQAWRIQQGLPDNSNRQKDIRDLPDYSFADGSPTPYGARQRLRILKQRQYTSQIIELTKEIDDAVALHAKKLQDKIDRDNQTLSRKLKKKSNKPLEDVLS